jgi:uncharacterized membrane protein YvbJ
MPQQDISKLSKAVTEKVANGLKETALTYIKANKTVVILAVAVILALIVVCFLMSQPKPNQEVAPSLEKVITHGN